MSFKTKGEPGRRVARYSIGLLLSLAVCRSALPAQQASRVRLGLGIAMQSQDAGAPRSGPAGSISAWIGSNPWVQPRVELGFGGYSLTGEGLLCPSVDYCNGSHGPGGFPELLTLHAGVTLGPQTLPHRGPIVTGGFTYAHGFGTERRHDRDALMPDVGAALRMWGTMFAEARTRWLANWEGGTFRQVSVGVIWRHP